MAKQTERSIKASKEGIEKANIALQKFDSVADLAAQIGASRKTTRGASPKTTVGMSRGTIYKFLKGEPVQRREFHEICKKLKLDWQEVVDLPRITTSEPAEKLEDNNSDIDGLVREVRSHCCDKIQHLYSKIRLLNRQQIDIDQLYVDVYVLKKLASDYQATIPALLKDYDPQQDRLGLGQRGKRSSGFELATLYHRLMVLGKPGSGKSTFLRHLAIACCKGEFQADRIPILIELRFIKDTCQFNLLNAIHQELGLADREQTTHILNQGKVLILLDGLDEVPSQSRRDVQDHIYEFSQSQQYYKNRFILTCRTQTAESNLSNFDYVEVADLNPEQVKIFAENWFTALAETPEQGAELTVKFLDKLRLPKNKPTAELAVTPILLSLVCWIFIDSKDLPTKRSDLYEQGINLLLKEWDKNRGITRQVGNEIYRKLSVKDKKKLLSYLAARKFKQEQYVLFEQSEIEEYIAEYLNISTEDAEAVLEAIEAQHGLLIERAKGIYSFSHLTFQEYFTAKWFGDLAQWDGLVSHITQKNWREVFLLTFKLILNSEDVHKLLLLMKEITDNLIASDNILQEFLMEVKQKASFMGAVYKKTAIRAFYIALNLGFPYDISYKLNLKLNFEKDVTDDLKLDDALVSTLNWALKIEEGVVHARAAHKILEFAINIQRNRIHALEVAQANAIESAAKINRKYTQSVQIEINVRKLTLYIMLNQALQLWNELQKLKSQLPDRSEKNRGNFERWWKDNKISWLGILLVILSKYRNMYQFSRIDSSKRESFSLYYDANKLLIDCLNSGCVVSDGVREEIEDTLLLPLAEIKKRQQ